MAENARKALENPQHEAFAQAVGVDRLSFSAAYSLAYPDNGQSPDAVRAAGARLAKDKVIRARIAVLAARTTEKAVTVAAYSLDCAISEAEEARQSARSVGQSSAEVAAVKLKAQLAGHVIDKKEVSSKNTLEDATLAELQALRDELTRRITDKNKETMHQNGAQVVSLQVTGNGKAA